MERYHLPPLAEWSFETVLDLVTNHEFEPGFFDFKEVLNLPKEIASGPDHAKVRDELAASIRKTVCSMANTDGGYVIFGVADRKAGTSALDPASRIVGIPRHGDHRKEVGDKLRSIQPEIHFDASPRLIDLPYDTDRGILVLRIPRSPLRPHMLDHVFYRRGDGGSAVQMTYFEVRDQLVMTNERRRRALLFQLELKQIHRQVKDLLRMELVAHRYPDRFDVSAYKVLLADVVTMAEIPELTLEQFLEIPSRALTLNRFLDLTAIDIEEEFSGVFGTAEFTWKGTIRTRAEDLERSCTARLNDLTVLLGSFLTSQQSTCVENGANSC